MSASAANESLNEKLSFNDEKSDFFEFLLNKTRFN